MKQTTYKQAVTFNLEQANEQLRTVHGTNPTDVVMTAMSIAQAFATCALVAAVQELTDEIRKLRQGE